MSRVQISENEIQVDTTIFLNINELWIFISEAEVNAHDSLFGQTEFDFDFSRAPYDDWCYHDSFSGFYTGIGLKNVWFRSQSVWSTAYSGGMLPKFWGELSLTQETFAFLKDMSGCDPIEGSLCGPNHYENKGWLYHNNMEGDIRHFNGIKTIIHKGNIVFEQNYIGGLIVHQF